MDADWENPTLLRIQRLLLRLWASFELPANALDQLTELLGGKEAIAGRILLFLRHAGD